MIKITGTTIMITRSDSAFVKFKFVDANNDIITFDGNVTVQVRSATNDDYNAGLLFTGDVVKVDDIFIWGIKPEDTATADGDYFWDAQIEFDNGDTYTFVEASKFKVKPEVTLRSSEAIDTNAPGLLGLNSYVMTIQIPGEVEVS